MDPAAGMLMEVRRLLDEGAFRASRAQRFCTGAADTPMLLAFLR